MSEADVKQAIQKVMEKIEDYEDFLWDLSDPDQVEVEYDTGEWGRVDYALLESEDGEPSIILEAKAFRKQLTSASAQRQIMSYAEGTKRGYAVLADGDKWMVYDLQKRGRFQNKLIVDIALSMDSVASSGRMLNQLLRRSLHWKK